jgi:hypothetical protein
MIVSMQEAGKGMIRLGQAMRQMGENVSQNLRLITAGDIESRCHDKGFLFAHAIYTPPCSLRVICASVLVGGTPDPEMIQRARELVEECEDVRPAGVQITVEHRHVTSQQLEVLQSLVRLVGSDEACIQMFGVAVPYLRRFVGKGNTALEENDEEFRARIIQERQGGRGCE